MRSLHFVRIVGRQGRDPSPRSSVVCLVTAHHARWSACDQIAGLRGLKLVMTLFMYAGEATPPLDPSRKCQPCASFFPGAQHIYPCLFS